MWHSRWSWTASGRRRRWRARAACWTPLAWARSGGGSLLLADEPTGALDALTGESVMGLLRQRCAAGCAVVLATHNVRHAAWADRVVFLNDGRLAGATGPAAGPEYLLGTGQAR